ncbi:hypothetical protein WH47_03777 [Habropoda laboriosa]|uniref:Uncharacterized protein n=1 Tax=Habropoda laboriosa TaxID=597456 RepID=A0A0L7QUZ1_9HYME|nr:hypothetical protein WH47_03777 [Habropoda laboriosa]
MKLLKIRLFFFVLLCTMASVMSINFQPSMAAPHHGKGVGCHGRRPGPPYGENGGNNATNGDTNGGNTNGQNGETEQI